MKSVTFKNLKAQMPVGYPDQLINFTYDDLKQISLKRNSNARTGSSIKVSAGNTFDEIVESVRKKYPDFDKANPEEYKKFFPDLSVDQIIAEQETIFQYIESLMGYEVAMSVATLGEVAKKRSLV